MTPRCTHTPAGAAAERSAIIASAVPVLTTQRLILRAPRIGDLSAWTRVLGDDPNRHMGGPLDDEAAFEAFCVYVSNWMLHGHGLWTIERRADGETLGFVQLGIEWEDPEPELGWSLLPEYRGHGFATEAAQAAHEYGLTHLGAGRFVSYVAESNLPSQRVANRLGAVQDGVLDGSLVYRHVSTGGNA